MPWVTDMTGDLILATILQRYHTSTIARDGDIPTVYVSGRIWNEQHTWHENKTA